MMINKKLQRIALLVFLSFSSVTVVAQGSKQETSADKKGRGKENRGDREFVKQKFSKAMTVYESAFKYNLTQDYSANLHLKAARLYMSLLEYPKAIPHYDIAMSINEDLFSGVDVCNYLDALRFTGEKVKAIELARKYAYRDVYSLDQRYQNILHSLNYENGFMPIGSPEYLVRPLNHVNTINSEYWVGVKDGEYFYATSKSPFHDPNKKFYHRTRYYSLDQDSDFAIGKEGDHKKSLLDMIPTALQNGPMAFSDDMTKIVVTQVYYDGNERVGMNDQGMNMFKTKLYHSDYDTERRRWSAFKEAFPQKEGFSYSHPFLFNNDRSLIFSSDMPGGYGGYDLYVSHWNDNIAGWGDPVNLGTQVNTEGDEISPSLFKNVMIFSSNGHVGFGGYDVYGILFESEQVVAGSLYHFDYPINTLYNDFSLVHIDQNRGYVVSDRNQAKKDDIFYFERRAGFYSKSNIMSGLSESKAISTGSLDLLTNDIPSKRPLNEALPRNQFSVHMLSVYFDFDSNTLSDDMLTRLLDWKDQADFSRIDTLVIEGYADEIGGKDYNQILSEKRAIEVNNWLRANNLDVKFVVRGYGQISVNSNFKQFLPSQNIEFLGQSSNLPLPLGKRIELNHDARRVDIKAIIK